MAKFNSAKIAFVFPGQGSQLLGMGYEICAEEPDSKNAFNMVAQECAFDLAKLCWNGPEEALRRTCHTQPALLATSAACLQALRRYLPINPLCVAGHSLGELSALWAAEALLLKEAAQLTVLRGQLMENSLPGAMSAILGMEVEKLEEICQEAGVVVANYNTPQQQVISGAREAIEKANDRISQTKAKIIPLQVGGAFHSPLMQDANQKFAELVDKINFKNAICPIIQNIDGQAYIESKDLQNNLKQQMTSSVQWVKTIQKMLEMGTEAFIEIGSGKILSGLIKKIDRSANVLQVSDPVSLKETLQNFENHMID